MECLKAIACIGSFVAITLLTSCATNTGDADKPREIVQNELPIILDQDVKEGSNKNGESKLPDDLSEEEFDIITSLQGTWKNDFDSDIKLIFNGLKVQYINLNKDNRTEYIEDLEFIKSGYTDYLVNNNYSAHKENSYLYYNDELNLYYYDGKTFEALFQTTYSKLSDSVDFISLKDLQETELRYPSIGMTKDEVIASKWGNPLKINKTTNKYGVYEQWIYLDNKYVYFDNGYVSTIQE